MKHFPVAENPVRLALFFRLGDKLADVCRVKRKHVGVTRIYATRAESFPQGRGLFVIQIPGHPSCRIIPVYGEDGDIDGPGTQEPGEFIKPECVATVVDMVTPKCNNIAHKQTLAVFVAFDFIMLCRNAMEGKVADLRGTAVGKSGSIIERCPGAL